MDMSMIERLRELDDLHLEGLETEEEENERYALRMKLQKKSTDDARRQTDRRTEGGRRLTFREAVTRAEVQIGFCDFSRQNACYGLIHDMCRAMAEVYMMNPATVIRVAGENLEAGLVAEVLSEVTQEMAEDLANDLRDRIAGVTCIKSYLRSALYIKVFEFETAEVRLEEQVRRDMENVAIDHICEKIRKGTG